MRWLAAGERRLASYLKHGAARFQLAAFRNHRVCSLLGQRNAARIADPWIAGDTAGMFCVSVGVSHEVQRHGQVFHSISEPHSVFFRFADSFCRRAWHGHRLGNKRAAVRVFGGLAVGHQHGHDHCHLSHNFPRAELAEPGFCGDGSKIRRIASSCGGGAGGFIGIEHLTEAEIEDIRARLEKENGSEGEKPPPHHAMARLLSRR